MSRTGKTRNTNQISENIYCNSEAYNPIYNSTVLLAELNNIKPSVDSLLTSELVYFSHFLKVYNGIPPVGQEVNIGYELNRRGLNVSAFIPSNLTDMYILSIGYTYTFNYHSPHTKYYIRMPYVIDGRSCKCIGRLAGDIYIFKTSRIQLFHYTFHDVNNNSALEKSVGAFHLKIDCINRIYRPFIIHPVGTSYEFYKFSDFDNYLNGYYTTTYRSSYLNELSAYLTRVPSDNKPYLINTIIGPIYDMLVTGMLNDLAYNSLPTDTIIPVPVLYTNQHRVIRCADMITNPGPKPPYFGGGSSTGKKSRKRSNSLKLRRRRTSRRYSSTINDAI